jgi:hypothetical protein
MKLLSVISSSAALFTITTNAFKSGTLVNGRQNKPKIQMSPRQLPAEPTGVQTIITPNGVNITYKEPGKEGICETTPGVSI